MMLPLVQSVLVLIGMLWIAFRLDRGLALLSLIVVPFLYYSVGYYVAHVQTRLRDVQDLEGQSLSIVHEAMSMLRVIVAFGRESHEYERFRSQGQQALDARVQVTVRQTWFAMAVNTSTAIGTALVLWFGASRVLDGHLSIGQLLVVMAYIASVYKPLQTISTALGTFQEYRVNLRRAFDLLDLSPEIADRANARVLVRAEGRITFEAVSFGYDSRPGVLRAVSFDVPAGHAVAIVGSTGAGKSTLVSLVPRFFDPSGGVVRLDGIDVRDLALRSLRGQVALVLQDPLLFSGTIADNIRYGRLDASEDDVIRAARAANAHDFIVRLPRGYETVLGERGTHVSGGERQRIAVARAFLKDAPVLILDEPTSSIDSRTEAVILDALDRLMAGRTTITIAHRLSTIRHADQILVLQDGAIAERGTHEDLVALGGIYRHMLDAQSGALRERRVAR
jgi:ABC-type multidrug transport system fused ATPase/permease subunit